jgi:selenocysteine insertion sequence-binding protein 2
MLLQANMRRWYVCGLREVRKAIKSGKARAVLLAPNIEQIEAEGALNDSVDDIIASCGAAAVPVVFALSRKKMGEVYGFRKRMSAIALLEVGGVQEIFEQVLSLAADGRRRWVEYHPDQAAADAAAAVAAAAAAQLASEGVTSGEGEAGPAAAAAGVSTNGSAAASAAVAAASTAAGVAASSSSGS